MYKSFIKLIVSLSLFFTSSFSLAQIALEEMVVTSQKREQNLLDVPSALQAFSGSMLEGAGVRDTDDLVNMIPDMLMSGEDAGRANIWLRGIGSTKFDIGSEGSNAFFVDEIYMARGQSILTGLVDLERIEREIVRVFGRSWRGADSSDHAPARVHGSTVSVCIVLVDE